MAFSAGNIASFGRMLALVEFVAPEILQAGRIIFRAFPGGKITPQTEEELQKEFSKDVRAKLKNGFNDATHVIKVSEAIKCVEKTLSDQTLMARVAAAMVKDLIAGKLVVSPSEDIANACAECFRENCLRSDTPRVKQTVTYYGRPAKGHGSGRKTIGKGK